MIRNRIIKVEEDRVPHKTAPQVSLFRGYNNSAPAGVVSLSDFLLSSTYKAQIGEIRSIPDKTRRRELKSKLPAITPSGVFSKRSNSGLIRHSGFICIDIDGQDNPDISDWEALKSSVSDLAGLWYAGLSASGNGLFLVFKVKYPEKHSEHFNSLARDVVERGITIDAQCKDVSRLRGASYDPQPLYCPSVAPHEGLLDNQARTPRNPQNPERGSEYPAGLTAIRVSKLVDAIERTGANIAELYPDWYAVGRALSSEFGEAGRAWYHSISRQSQKYDPAECDEQYDRCLATCSQTSIRTLFWICKQNGIMTL